jgi:hypothetical protein
MSVKMRLQRYIEYGGGRKKVDKGDFLRRVGDDGEEDI